MAAAVALLDVTAEIVRATRDDVAKHATMRGWNPLRSPDEIRLVVRGGAHRVVPVRDLPRSGFVPACTEAAERLSGAAKRAQRPATTRAVVGRYESRGEEI